MSFVEWVTALVLLAVGLGGLYGAVNAFLNRRVEVSPYTVTGWGAVALGLVYLGGAAVALLAMLAIFLGVLHKP